MNRVLALVLQALIPVVAVAALYSGALFNGFVWDDGIGLPYIPYLGKADVLTLVLGGSTMFSPNYFRPLAALFSAAEVWLFDLFPVYFHLANIALHAANTVLVGCLAAQFRGQRSQALDPAPVIAALLYGLHPALVEPVVWVSSAGDLLLTHFLLFGLCLDGWFTRRWLREGSVALAFLFALLTKEMAVTFPLLLVLVQLARSHANPLTWRAGWQGMVARGDHRVLIALCLAALCYLAMRVAVLGHLWTLAEPAAKGVHDLGGRLWLLGASVAKFLVALTGPFTAQRPMHLLELPLGPTSNMAWLGILAVLALGLALWRSRLQLSAAGWLWLAVPVSLLPVSNLIPVQTGPGFFAERFLTFPLALTCIAVTLSLAPVAAGRPARRLGIIGLTLAWLAACASTVLAQVPRWENDRTLWAWTVEVEPRSGYAHLQLIDTLKRQGAIKAGIAASERATRQAESEYLADFKRNLGFFLLEDGQHERAIRELTESRDLYRAGRKPGIDFRFLNLFGERQASGNPEYVLAINIGVAYTKIGRPEAALHEFQAAAELEPQEPTAYVNIGQHYLDSGQPALALAPLETAVERYRQSYRGEGRKILAARDLMDAEAKLRLARELTGRADSPPQ